MTSPFYDFLHSMQCDYFSSPLAVKEKIRVGIDLKPTGQRIDHQPFSIVRAQ